MVSGSPHSSCYSSDFVRSQDSRSGRSSADSPMRVRVCGLDPLRSGDKCMVLASQQATHGSYSTQRFTRSHTHKHGEVVGSCSSCECRLKSVWWYVGCAEQVLISATNNSSHTTARNSCDSWREVRLCVVCRSAACLRHTPTPSSKAPSALPQAVQRT